MKVYEFNYIGGYGGGLALVAANNQEEAMNIFIKGNTYGLHREEVGCEVRDNILTTEDEPCFLAEDFYIE